MAETSNKAMTGKPILFSGPMIRALLDGRKTQTRRVLKTQPSLPFNSIFRDEKHWYTANVENEEEWEKVEDLRVPYAVGQHLWCKETHAFVPVTAYRQSVGVQQTTNPNDTDMAVIYREGWQRSKPGPWKPSIFMPKWASRLTLTVTGVKVERVQNISEEDAKAEGAIQMGVETGQIDAMSNPIEVGSYRLGFSELWNSLNEKRGYGWDKNPWVVAISFTVHKRNINERDNDDGI